MKKVQYGLSKDQDLNNAKRLFASLQGSEPDDIRVISLQHHHESF
jgi:hypothetical protein